MKKSPLSIIVAVCAALVAGMIASPAMADARPDKPAPTAQAKKRKVKRAVKRNKVKRHLKRKVKRAKIKHKRNKVKRNKVKRNKVKRKVKRKVRRHKVSRKAATIHARRMAKLRRIKAIAAKKGDKAALAKVNKLIRMEMARWNRLVSPKA